MSCAGFLDVWRVPAVNLVHGSVRKLCLRLKGVLFWGVGISGCCVVASCVKDVVPASGLMIPKKALETFKQGNFEDVLLPNGSCHNNLRIWLEEAEA